MAWSSEVIDELEIRKDDSVAFIKNFARSISLADLPITVYPTSLAFDVAGLKESFYGEDRKVRLVRKW
ncbi:MAG: hypothetical protein ABI197_08430 [Granulicella sp.]